METTQAKLELLRDWMKRESIDAYCVPRADEYLGEYLPEFNERLHWLSGFTGSAGMAVVLADEAAIFVDGRYTVQVRRQVDENLFAIEHLIENPPTTWLAGQLKSGSRVVIDPRMCSLSWYESSEKTLAKAGILLAGDAQNPIDRFWNNRPSVASTAATLLDVAYSGETAASKRARMGRRVQEAGADAALLFAPESVSWLLNIRGDDVPCVPVVLAAAMLEGNGSVHLLIDRARVPDLLDEHTGGGVFVIDEREAAEFLCAWGGKTVLADPNSGNAWTQMMLREGGATLLAGDDPVMLEKACKNPVEIEGARAAHRRDALAVIRFLAWIDRSIDDGKALSEDDLAQKLTSLRAELELFQGPSFDTISAAGANAAMCHYNHLDNPVSYLERDSVYLVDSGGQYLDGTTDITRTVTTGAVSLELKRKFTLVLKGHIALDQARFSPGTTGTHLDALARQFLWAEGCDFDHGTGHGVGAYLSVHEGPQRIAKAWNSAPLAPGMVVSNEPGYYRDGAFGIRCENLLLVRECDDAQFEKPMLEFEAITLVPFDRRLIDVMLLTPEERNWVDQYHRRVLKELPLELLCPEDRAWLETAAAPLP
ncbi:MAG: aminopeptidase P family protein [Pseudomonadota bacterium]